MRHEAPGFTPYYCNGNSGGDAPLMAGITTLQTLVAAATLPLTLSLV